ncbi:MAG: sugar ABC transporter permease [Anaerolineae bacterium]|nr:sugar ABC transporter permease [Anaerolineae bacterium]
MAQSQVRQLRRKSFPFHILVFLAPGLLIYFVFMCIPLLDSLRLGLFATDGGVEQFVGLDNFVRLTSDPDWAPRFWSALGHSLVFFLINMLVQNPIALLLAALLASMGRSGAVYRTLIFAPTVLSLVITAFLWSLLLSPLWGLPKTILTPIGLAAFARPWLGLESTALPTLALMSIWQFIGVPVILYYAALIAIPNDFVEAAYVDGATGWDVFWRIKLPLILPVVGIVALMTFIFNFNAFDVVYAVKGALAGPNFASDTMMTFFYRTFFGYELQQPNPTMGAAIAGTSFAILMVGALFYIFVWQRRTQTYEM